MSEPSPMTRSHTIVPRILPVFISLLFKLACKPAGPEEFSTEHYFKEVTRSAGIDFVHEPGVDGTYFMPESIGSGCALFDFDNDGLLDIYLINGTPRAGAPTSNRLYRQQAGGTFVDVTSASGLGDTGYGMGVAIGDIDNDGFLDVYISNYGPDALYRNNGDGTFTNITASAGIDNPAWGCSVTFLDFDRDGYLDIFVTNYLAYDPADASFCMDGAGRQDYCGPATYPGVADVLFRNLGDGRFEDVSTSAGIAGLAYRGLGVVSADFNRDGLADIYVANDGDPNSMWLNNGDGTFRDVALPMGAAFNALGQAEAGMGVAIGDVDNSGHFDLFISHLRTESNTLYCYQPELGFIDITAAAGLGGVSVPFTGFGAGFLDIEHNGALDLIVVNGRVTRGPLLTSREPVQYWDHYAEPNLLFLNDGKGRFRRAGEQERFCALVENSRGLAIGDMDNDGDLDLLVLNEGGRARLFHNVAGAKGNWVMVRAVDPRLRRDAIGAELTVVAAGQRYLRLIQPGYSFLSSSDLRAHFGLGTATRFDAIEVRWPDGRRERFPGGEANRQLELRRGEGLALGETP